MKKLFVLAIFFMLVSSSLVFAGFFNKLELTRDFPNLNFPSASEILVTCGGTITTDTTLTEDITDCLSNGIIIGANDITLDCAGHTISGNFSDEGILLQSKTGVTIKNCNINKFDRGIFFENTSNNVIDSNTIIGNTFGIYIVGSSQDLVKNNIVTDNNRNGMYFLGEVNSLIEGNILDNNRNGLTLDYHSDNNIVKDNFVRNNLAGMYVDYNTKDNVIYNNYFDNNSTFYQYNVNADGFNNSWFIEKTLGTNIIGGAYLGGNYWSNYEGGDIDGDGIGDTETPFMLHAYYYGWFMWNYDRYPLTNKRACTVCGDLNADDNADISDLTMLIDYQFIHFDEVYVPCGIESAEVDGDNGGRPDIADLAMYIDHLFINFPELICSGSSPSPGYSEEDLQTIESFCKSSTSDECVSNIIDYLS